MHLKKLQKKKKFLTIWEPLKQLFCVLSIPEFINIQ